MFVLYCFWRPIHICKIYYFYINLLIRFWDFLNILYIFVNILNIFSLREWDFWDCGRDCGTCQLGLGSSAVCSRRHLSHTNQVCIFKKAEEEQKYIDVKCSSSSSISREALSLDQDCLHHQSPSSPYAEVSYWRFHASPGLWSR